MPKLSDADAVKHQLQKCIENSHNHKQALKKTLNNVLFSQVKNLAPAEQAECISLLMQAAGTELLSQPIVKYAGTKKIPLTPLASFRQQLTLSTLRRQLSGFQPEWVLNSKTRAFQFADALQLRRPKLLFTRKKFGELSLVYPSVIKPVDGAASRGVYLAIAAGQFKDVRTGQTLHDEAELLRALEADLATKRVAKDLWQAEELIADTEPVRPARDLKFYCFYGKVGFVLEVERADGGHYCEWLPDGQLANTGRYAAKAFTGNGFTEQELKLAESVSLQIPAAFMRIDFLKTSKDFVLGEFTPRPGKFDEFNPEFDNYLGHLYLQAEGRLAKDLYSGKQFELFSRISK